MSRGARARLFVAVDPPPEGCRELGAWGRALAGALDLRSGRGSRRGLRVLDPDSLHLTLCFLGARPVAEIDTLAAALGLWAGGLGELRVGAPLWPPPREAASARVRGSRRGRRAGGAAGGSRPGDRRCRRLGAGAPAVPRACHARPD